jgi:hypothetical protein
MSGTNRSRTIRVEKAGVAEKVVFFGIRAILKSRSCTCIHTRETGELSRHLSIEFIGRMFMVLWEVVAKDRMYVHISGAMLIRVTQYNPSLISLASLHHWLDWANMHIYIHITPLRIFRDVVLDSTTAFSASTQRHESGRWRARMARCICMWRSLWFYEMAEEYTV